MRNSKKRRRIQTLGLPPGTLIYTGEERKDFRISLISYSPSQYKRLDTEEIDECLSFSVSDLSWVNWIDYVGLHRTDIIEKIGKHFNLHPIVLEDILNVHQRPKIEYTDDYIFIVLKILTYNADLHSVDLEQVSVVLSRNFVITFQERESNIFDPIKERIKENRGIIRKNGADYLLYSLLDIIVDSHFGALEKLGEDIEGLEEGVVMETSSETVQMVHKLRRCLIDLRRSIWPVREILSFLTRVETDFIKSQTSFYLRDVYDHTVQVMDTIETMRDTVSGLLDVYLSSVSNRINEVMKVLAIIATIFMPLTFIAGIYGMNFRYMPELEWRYGYPFVLALMFIVAFGMIIYFKRKKWL